MSNHHLRNKELSLKAKGLLSQMLSLPEDWDYTLAGLSYINREKIDAIREAVRELERAGYIQRSRERDEKGRLRGTDYIIYEQPPNLDLPTLENPTLENPTQEKPTLENPMQLNKDIQKTDLPKKEKSNTDLSSNHSIPILSPNPSPLREETAEPERKGTEAADAYSVYEEIIKDNIEYEHFIKHTNIDRERLDEIVSLILETVCTKRKTFTLRQLHENVVNKYISISVASILMMLTIMLITDGSVRIMSYGSELTRGTSVYDFTVMGNDQIVEKYLSNEQIRPYVSNLNRMEIGNIKSTASDGISSPVDWSKFRKQIVQHLPQDVVDPATQEDGMYSFGSDQPAALNLLGLIDTGSSSPYLLPVSSYNRLLDAAGEKQISLGNNEVVYYLNPDFLGNAQDETVTLLNQIAADAQANNEALLSINERPFYLVPSVPMKGLTADENIKIITALIVSDEIYSEFVNSDTCMVYWNFCIPNELVETKGLMLPIMEARDLLKPSGLYYESYLNNFGRQLFYVISGSYTTLYMGFMFLIIACALLALQFLTQMQTTKSRYLTLSILGARREQIKRSINQQVLWYFLLPLILACISGAVGIYAMQLYLYSGAAHLEQSYPLLIAMAVIVVLVMVIYGVAVARTANREIGKLNYKPNS